MRVLLDANILISYLLVPQNSAISRIMAAVSQRRFTLLMPQAVIDELVATVTLKPRLTKRIKPEPLDELVTALLTTAEFLPPLRAEIPIMSRDRKDDYLLAYAVVGQADYLITGDVDLLVLGKIDDTLIMRPADFIVIVDNM